MSAAGDADAVARRPPLPVLVELGLSVGTAESLTGGLVCAALTSVPGASAVVRGGVVAYASEVKADVLGVDRDLLAREGAVCEPVAAQLADGIRPRAGLRRGRVDDRGGRPRPGRRAAGGHRVRGRRAGPGESSSSALALTGDREEIRAASVLAVLTLLERALENLRDGVGTSGYR